MQGFTFLSADNLEEAVNYLVEKDKIKVLAGGTDLLVDLHNHSKRLPDFDYILDITHLEELKYIREKEGYLEIGPLVSHTDLTQNLLLNQYFPILGQAAASIGSTQIRNRGTIGGNINNASPAADLLPVLIAYGAEVKLQAKLSQRTVALKEFITGPYRTDLQKGELLTMVRIPLPGSDSFADFEKIGRRKALSISRLNLAMVIRVKNKQIIEVSLVPGAATPYPRHFARVENALRGKLIGEVDEIRLGELAVEEMLAITGNRWSTPYKKPALAALVRRAVQRVIKEAQADGKN